MTLAVSTLSALYDGIGQQLAVTVDPAQNVAYLAAGTYPNGKVGIYPANVPTSPDKIIVLTPRPITADPTLADSEYGVTFRYRGTNDPRVVWALRDACRDAILGRWPLTLPNGLHVACVEFAGGGSIGQDASNRWQWVDDVTYRLGEHRASPF